MPKPRPAISRTVAHRLVASEGHLCADIAADEDAVDALDTATAIDRQQIDPAMRDMTRGYTIFRHDLRVPTDLRELATRLEECGKRAIQADRYRDEHVSRGRAGAALSADKGRAAMDVHEELLTGCES